MKIFDREFTYHGLSATEIDCCRDCRPDKTGYTLCDYHEAVVRDLVWPETPLK